MAQEFLASKNDSDLLKVFTTTLLAEPWTDRGEEIAEDELASRVESFSLHATPREVLALSVGVDVQIDRFEVTTVGWLKAGGLWILDHRQLWGRPPDPEDTVWAETSIHSCVRA